MCRKALFACTAVTLNRILSLLPGNPTFGRGGNISMPWVV